MVVSKITMNAMVTEKKAFERLNALIKSESQTSFDKASLIKYVMNTYDYSLRKVADKLGKSVGTLSDLMKAYDFLESENLVEECKDFDYTKISRYLRAIERKIYSVTEHPYAEMLGATQKEVREWEQVDKEATKTIPVYDADGNFLANIPENIIAQYAKKSTK